LPGSRRDAIGTYAKRTRSQAPITYPAAHVATYFSATPHFASHRASSSHRAAPQPGLCA